MPAADRARRRVKEKIDMCANGLFFMVQGPARVKKSFHHFVFFWCPGVPPSRGQWLWSSSSASFAEWLHTWLVSMMDMSGKACGVLSYTNGAIANSLGTHDKVRVMAEYF